MHATDTHRVNPGSFAHIFYHTPHTPDPTAPPEGRADDLLLDDDEDNNKKEEGAGAAAAAAAAAHYRPLEVVSVERRKRGGAGVFGALPATGGGGGMCVCVYIYILYICVYMCVCWSIALVPTCSCTLPHTTKTFVYINTGKWEGPSARARKRQRGADAGGASGREEGSNDGPYDAAQWEFYCDACRYTIERGEVRCVRSGE